MFTVRKPNLAPEKALSSLSSLLSIKIDFVDKGRISCHSDTHVKMQSKRAAD
jgi:hypothetical protein